MKKILTVLSIFILLLAPLGAAEKSYKLKAGIATVAKNLADKLPAGTKIVIFDIRSARSEASEYIIEELTYELLEIGTLVVVDRQSLEAIRSELTFQSSGDVSDESAQRLGAMLGAQTLVSGSLEKFGEDYRFAVKAVKVETSEIQYISSMTVIDNSETEALFVEASETPGVVENPPDPKPSEAAASIGRAVRGVADFTGRFICMSINPAFGIGSFMQGDTQGGGNVVFWEIVGAGALVYGAYRMDNDQSYGQAIFYAGGFSVGCAVIYSLIRPWTYNRAPKVAEALDNVRVTNTGLNDLSVGYVIKY